MATRGRRPRARARPAGPTLAPDSTVVLPADADGANGANGSPRRARRPRRRGPVADLLQRAVEEAARLLEADGAIIYLLDESTGTLKFAFDAGIAADASRRWVRRLELQLGSGMFGVAAAERRVVRTADYPNDHSFIHAPSADRFVAEVGLRSMVTAPLVAGDRVFGAMGTFSSRPDAFSDAQIGLVRALADHAAAAMANALLIEELDRSRAEQERRAEREHTLREIATRISSLHDPAEVIQETVDESARLLGAEGARIDLIEPDVGLLRWAYQSGARRPSDEIWPEDPDESLEQGVSGKAVVEGEVFFTGDYLRDDRFVHRPGPDSYIESIGVHSVMAAPLIGDRGPFGTLTIYTTRPDAWGKDDANLLEALATEAAIALRNARMIEELARSRAEITRRADSERTLREIAARITAIRDPDEILHQVLDASTRLLGASGAMINLVGATGTDPSWAWAQEDRPANFQVLDSVSLEPESGVSGLAIATGVVQYTADYLADERFLHSEEREAFVRDSGIRSVIAAPVMVGDTPTGTITVYSPESDAFDDSDAELMKALADQAAVTITNAQLIEQLEHAREEVERRADAERSLREIATNISAIRDSDVVLQQTINEATRLLRGDGGIIDLLDADSGTLRWAYDTGMFREFDPDRFGPAETQLGKGIAGRAVLERRVIRTGDYSTHEFVHTQTADEFAAQLGIHSVIVAPILGEAGPVGAIEVYARRSDAFDDLDAAVLSALADQAAIAIQNARLIEALDRSAEEIRRRADAERALRQIAANITSIRDADVILQQTVDEAKRLLNSTDARIDLLEGGKRLHWTYTSELSDLGILHEMDADFEVGEGVAGKVVAEGRPFRTGNYLEDGRFPHTTASDDFVRAAGLQSALAVPLTGDSGVLGAISVATPRADAYDDGDTELLLALADQATIAIQNAALIGELQRSQAELAQRADTERSLREMAARIAELRDPDELLRRIVEESRRLLGSDGAHLTRMGDDGQALVPVVVTGELGGVDQAALMALRFPVMGGINGLAAGTGQPAWTDDYLADRRIPHEPGDDELAEQLGLRSMAAVPLASPEGGIIGTLAVSFRQSHSFDEEELALLKGLADHAAIAITNTSLYERLGDSERAYRHLVQNSPDLIWSIDSDARFTFISDTSERFTGWKPEEVLGRHFGALVHESSREVAEIDWTQGMVSPQQELRGRLNLLHKDGHPIPAEFTAMGTLDDEGRFVGANGSVRDMTERDRLERELRDSEERYRFLVENSPDIVFSTDAQGVYTYYSDTVERLAGWKSDELIGRHFSTLIEPATFPDAAIAWQRFVDEPTRLQVHRFSLRHREGRLLPVEVSAVGITDDEGRFAGIHGAARDVSDRERLERDLRRQAAELASGEERAHLARELHDSVTQALFSMTLLNRTIEMLLDRDPDAARAQLKSLRELQREALAEMRALIFELRPGNLEQDGLDKALRTHSAALQGRIGLPIVVNAELDDRLPIAIEEVLYRIAQEALHNIVKHAGAREVRLELQRDGGGVRLRIVDDGKGFDPTKVPDGHLGLAGMRVRADKIGGRLEVTSRPGAGTTIEAIVSEEAIAEAANLRELGVAASAE